MHEIESACPVSRVTEGCELVVQSSLTQQPKEGNPMKRIGILFTLMTALMLGLPAMAADDANADDASEGTTTEEEAPSDDAPPADQDAG